MANRRFQNDFDIRVSTAKTKARTEKVERQCEWEDCTAPGAHPAPKSPRDLRSYRWFCTTHAREYNRSWNYFAGMDDADIETYVTNNSTWQRPTWKMGGDKSAKAGESRSGAADPFGFIDDGPGAAQSQARRRDAPTRPRMPKMTEEALAVLDLDYPVTLQQVKARYKELVKRFHPDANGGDRSTEEQLKRTIWAYNHLKASTTVRR